MQPFHEYGVHLPIDNETTEVQFISERMNKLISKEEKERRHMLERKHQVRNKEQNHGQT